MWQEPPAGFGSAPAAVDWDLAPDLWGASPRGGGSCACAGQAPALAFYCAHYLDEWNRRHQLWAKFALPTPQVLGNSRRDAYASLEQATGTDRALPGGAAPFGGDEPPPDDDLPEDLPGKPEVNR